MTARCDRCGSDIPADAAAGLCPLCLIRSALGDSQPPTRFEVPTVDELQAELPQLEILEPLGRGGMGAVYIARQRSLDRLIAVKILPRDLLEDSDAHNRFQQEARLLANLSHPNIVTAYEFGQTDTYYYLLMELVRGVSLRRLLADRPLFPTAATQIIAQVCDALAYAHGRGVIHRDIKPENILLEDSPNDQTLGRVRVVDFGLAKLVSDASDPESQAGTPEYMAPEQRESPTHVDHRADIYAVGVTLHEMLTGHLPDRTRRRGILPYFGNSGVNVDPRLWRVIERCLEEDPARRYQQIAELSADLAPPPKPEKPKSSLMRVGIGGSVAASLLAAIVVFAVSKPRVVYAPRPRPATTTRFWQPAFEDPLADRAGTVFQIDGAPSYANTYLVDRILKLTNAKGHSARYSDNHIYLKVVPPADPKTLTLGIDFATVQRIEANTIFLRVDPKAIPAALPPAIRLPSDPNFFRQNLADLTSWDVRRQLEAAERLSKVEGKGPRDEIRIALESFYKSSGDALARRYAVEGLGVWGDPSSLPALEAALRDSNFMVRRSATFAAAKVGRGLAAEMVARQLADDYRTASDALRLIGPDAERAVWPYLKHENTFTRQAAAKVLQDIGTGDSLRPLIEAESSSDHFLSEAARQAREAIERRKAGP